MPFCFNCGQQLDDNAKVCFSCGTARPEQQIDDENYSQRKNEYIGKIKKCPSCGAEIKSFVGICPECGHEINESSVSPTLSIFSEKVNWFDNKIDSFSEYRRTRWVNWQLWQQILWIILNIYTYGIATLISSKKYKKDLQHKKESFIESYVVPNDRESIIELLLFIKMQISSIISNKGNKNANRWLIIWKNKAEQVYQKSEIMFSGDKIANDAINYIRENCDAFIDKSIKRNKIKYIIISILLISFVAFTISGTIKSNQISLQNDYNKIVFEDVELNIPNYWTKQSSSSDNDVYVIGKNNLSVMNIMKEHFNCKYNENNLVAAKDNIEKLITSWYINIDGINNLRFLNSEEYKNKNGVYGIKYMYSMKLVANNNEFDINGQCFVFLSKDGYSINVCRLIFPQSDSSFDYSGDFSKLIDTIEYK